MPTRYRGGFNNPYYRPGGYSPNQKIVDDMVQSQTSRTYMPLPKKRSGIDRAFDALSVGQYVTQGALRGMVDEDTGVLEGMWKGLKGANPFGDDYKEGEYRFSDNLGQMGWNPESGLGKFARGAVGFMGDVMLDPLTYLSFGTAPLIKGTGKAGAKLTHGTIKYGDEVLDVAKGLDIGKALDVVRKYGDFVDEEDLYRQANNLFTKFNKSAGLAEGGRGVTLSLANAPFGEKIFKGYADKSLNIVDADTIRAFSDNVGISKQYSKVRDAIYGTKFGKLFNTKSALYRASKESPERVYEILRQADYKQRLALKMGKDARNYKNIAEDFKDLSPDERKQIIELMEDKSQWNKITKTFDEIDMQEAEVYRKEVEAIRQDAVNRIDNLKETKKQMEMFSRAKDDELLDVTNAMMKLDDEYAKTLKNINVNHINDVEKVKELRKFYEDEIVRLQREVDEGLAYVDEFNNKMKFKTPEDITKNFDDYKSKIEQNKENVKAYKDLKTSIGKNTDSETINNINLSEELYKPKDISDKMVNKIAKELKQNGFKSYKDKRSAKKFAKMFPEWEEVVTQDGRIRFYPPEGIQKSLSDANKIKTPDDVYETVVDHKHQIIEDVSNYLYGRPDMISKATWDNNLEEVVGMIKRGNSKEDILKHISKNKDFYSGRANTIYGFIGKEMGYGKGTKYPGGWKEMYWDRMDDLLDKMKAGHKLTASEERLYTELEQLKYIRDEWLSNFRKADNMSGVKKIMAEHENMKLSQTWDETSHLHNSTMNRYGTDYDEIKKHNALNIKRSESSIYRENLDWAKKENIERINIRKQIMDLRNGNGDPKKIKTLQKKLAESIQRSKLDEIGSEFMERRTSIYDDLFDEIFVKTGSDKNFGTEQMRWLDEVTTEYESLVVNKANNLPYKFLSDKQKDMFKKIAINKVNKRRIGETAEELSQKDYLEMLKKVKDNVKGKSAKEYATRGMKVRVDFGDDWEGVIQNVNRHLDGEVTFTIKNDAGEIIEDVASNRIFKMFQDDSVLQLDDMMKTSDIVNEQVNKIDDFKKMIDDAKNNIAKLDTQYETTYHKVIDEYTSKIDDMELRIEDIQKERAELTKAFRNGELDKTDDIYDEIKRLDETLNNDDVLMDYIKLNYGDDALSAVTKQRKVELAERVLDERTDISERVKNVAKVLRGHFLEMGEKEVALGKLTKEQLEAMTNRYLPHILTEDGKKLFQREDVFKRMQNFGDDLGYGRVFNDFSIERTLKNIPDGKGGFIAHPNVLEANEYLQREFGDILQGKNAFAEDISDIFITRAMKHSELMYDDKYMDSMMNVLGKAYKGGTSEDGYKTVYNYGQLKNYTKVNASTKISLDISDAVSDYVSDPKVIEEVNELVANRLKDTKTTIRNYNYTKKKLFNEEIGKKIQSFIVDNFDDTVRRKMQDNSSKAFLTNTKLEGSLDDLAMPMIEINPNQYDNIIGESQTLQERLLNNVRGKAVFNEDTGKYTFKGGLVSYYKSKYIEMYGKFPSDEELLRITKMSKEDALKFIDEQKQYADDIDMEKLNRITNKFDKFDELNDVRVKQVYSPIADKVNQSRKLQIQKDNSRFLQIWDKFTHLIKLNQTTVLPSFHTRNKASDTFNNWLAIGEDAVNIDLQKKTFKAILKEGKIDGAVKITKPNGKVGSMTWEELYNEALDRGVIDKGIFAQELGVGGSSGALRNLKVPGKFDPTDTKNFGLYKKGAKIGSTVESQDRLIHFVSRVKNGATFEEATESVNKFLFDYSDLTMFEQGVMKRIIPYYTWMRKNTPLQLEMMMNDPKKYMYVSKVMRGIEGFTPEEDRIDKNYVNDFAMDWIQLPFNVTNPQGREEPVLLNPNLPFMDINNVGEMLDPANVFSNINPLIKVPAEQLMNKNTFFDSPISEEKGARQIPDRLDHVGSQMSLYNTGKGFVKKRGIDLGLHTLNTVSGIKGLSYDYDAFKAMKIDELIKKQKEIQNERGSFFR